MGLINFIKNAGEKLFGNKDDEKKIEAEVKAHNSAVERLEELKRERALQLKVERMGLDVDDLRVKVDNGRVTLNGRVKNQHTSEIAALTVGNVEGVEAVDNRLQVSNPEPEAKFYTVERGDTLSKIAKEHYGNASKYPAIFEANRPMLKDPDKIYPGQVLRIPPQ